MGFEPSDLKSLPTVATGPRGEPRPKDGEARFPVVGIGASAGGLEAFTELLKHLPLDTGMAFVLVQHLDPHHESALTQLLTRATSLPVREVTNNLRLEPDNIYVIPRNANLGIALGVLKLHPRPDTHTPHRSIDIFLESLAEDQRERAIGVILSGTATDGTLGLEAIKAEGGITFAQDDSARYDSMPHSAVAAGCVDFVLSPEGIAKELACIAKHPYIASDEWRVTSDERKEGDSLTTRHSPLATPSAPRHSSLPPNGFKKILLLLRNHSGVDFSLYKSTTIQRRIARRLVLNKLDTLENYADFLRGNAKELHTLYADLLISVTSFFRTSETFDFLKDKVWPKFLEQHSDQPVRVWVLGCSTGQEAYSLAMTFVEAAENASRIRKLQVFATDLNDALLDKARRGLYPRSLVQDVSPERLRRFFVEEEGGYRVIKALREMVVFARQNLINDPPFSRMDLISCRNLLIYLEASLQKKLFPVLHYALKPEGFLFLGASESIGTLTDLFEPRDKKHKIYSKKPALARPFQLPVKKERGGQPSSRGSRKPGEPLPLEAGQAEATEGLLGELSVQREADRLILNQFAPPSVLVNADLQILQFRGPTGDYLEPPTGKASFEVLKMARHGLMLPLRAAINKAKKENKTARKENLQVKENGTTRRVNLEVIPLKNLRERCFLILFKDAEKAGGTIPSSAPPTPPQSRSGRRTEPSRAKEESRLAELESELRETRDYLESIQQEHEAANEELQASNEEVQSANEELQSMNEELETSKEELESANEELTTVNEELAHRNHELHGLNSDLVNIQTSAHLAIVLLGRDLTIRRFSAQAERQFHLQATDVGRPFSQVRHNLVFEERRGAQLAAPPSTLRRPEIGRRQTERLKTRESAGSASATAQSRPDLESFIAESIATVRERQREARDSEGRWYSLRVRPYLTLDNRVDGAVLVLVDISDLKRHEQNIAAARDYAEGILRMARDPLVVLNADLRVHTANEAFYSTFKVQPAESIGRLIYDLGNRQWDIPRLRQLLGEVLPRSSFFDNLEVTHDFERIGRRTMLLSARTLTETVGQPARILLGIQNVTEVLSFQAAARESQTRYQALIEASAQIVWTTDSSGVVVKDSPSWRAFTGQTYEQWQGFGWLDVIHPDDRERFSELWQRAVTECTAVDTEYRLRHISGDWRWTTVRAVPVSNSDGSIHEWVGMNIDITGRKQGEEARAKLAAIVESSDDAIVGKDLNGIITSWNKGAEGLFGYTAHEVIGKPVTILIPQDRFDEEPSILQRIREGAHIEHFETVRRRKDGTLLDVSLTVSPVVDSQGQVVGASKIARDITERKRTEEALRKSEERFTQFMRHLPGLAWIKDWDGRYVYANDAAERVFATPRAELYGKTDQELFPPETAAQFTRNDQQALVSELGIQTIETLTHADAIVHHSIVSKFPVPTPDGKEIMVGGVAFDITERKHAEEALRESEERFRLLADTAPVLIWVNGLDGCEYVNREYLQFLGRTMEEVQRMNWATAMHPDDAEAYLGAYLQALEERTPFEAQFRFRREDGEYRWMKSAGLPRFAADGKFLGYVGCSLDVTDIKEYQQALTEADRRKNEFLAMLAHELRNPLAPIRNALEILRLADGNIETVQSVSQMMDRQIGQMVRLVDDLLDVSRISRGKIELRRGFIDLASCAHHAVEAVRPLCESKGLHLTVTMPPDPVYLNADPVRLAQVVGNLLNNACKFTNSGGSIELVASVEGRVAGGEKSDEWRVTSDEKEESSDGGTRLSATQGSDDIGKQDPKLAARRSSLTTPYVTIRVRDNGIGIPTDQLPRIFDMFTQVDTSLERTRAGLGIGLTLAKSLVELHDGTLDVHSGGLGQGSEFVVRLPVASNEWRVTSGEKAQSGGDALATHPSPLATIRKRILVVDDNLDSAESLTILLDLAGNETHTAYDGLEALEAAAKLQPDVILLDIGLPELNGYDVASKIREQPWGKQIMLVALTGWGQEEDRKRSHDAGFDYHLTKPVDPVALQKLLAEGPRVPGTPSSH